MRSSRFFHVPRLAAGNMFFPSVILLVLAAPIAGCGGSSGNSNAGGQSPPPVAIATVSISPSAASLEVGATVQLTARALTASGQGVDGAAFTWSADRLAVATVTNGGLVQAMGEGETPIRARAGSIEGSIVVRIVEAPPGPVASVEISPPNATINEGDSTQFTAIARDASGKVITGRGEAWAGGDSTIVFVEPLGKTTGLRAGSTTVSVKIDGSSASAGLKVESGYPYSLVYSASQPLAAPQIYWLNVNDPAAVPMALFAGRSATDPTPSPDGLALAFVVTSSTSTQIFRANLDGSNIVQLTSGAGFRDQPAWSPDGLRIAYRDRVSGMGTDIWTINALDGSDASNLTSDLGATNQGSPAWSPVMIGGVFRIAYSHSEGGYGHLWTMHADGTDKRQITSSTTAYDDQPSWSPDGSRLVFQRSGTAIFGDIYWVDANLGGAGAALMPIIGPLAGPQFAPTWSPDGRLVAFASRHITPEYQIYTVWADGTRLAQRTFAGEHADPAWVMH